MDCDQPILRAHPQDLPVSEWCRPACDTAIAIVTV